MHVRACVRPRVRVRVRSCACVRAVCVSQTTHKFVPLSPDESDAAVRRSPIDCPHYATGDRRDGRRLLADFPRSVTG